MPDLQGQTQAELVFCCDLGFQDCAFDLGCFDYDVMMYGIPTPA